VAAQKYPKRVFPIPMHDNPGAESGLPLGYCFEIVLNICYNQNLNSIQG